MLLAAYAQIELAYCTHESTRVSRSIFLSSATPVSLLVDIKSVALMLAIRLLKDSLAVSSAAKVATMVGFASKRASTLKHMLKKFSCVSFIVFLIYGLKNELTGVWIYVMAIAEVVMSIAETEMLIAEVEMAIAKVEMAIANVVMAIANVK